MRKAGLELDLFGFEEWSESRIRQEFPRAAEDVFPDSVALTIVREADGRARPQTMRWGFPLPASAPASRLVTNVRNLSSPYWRGWLQPRQRCLVPATAFSEWSEARPKREHWFATGADEPLFMFAGIWRPWTGARGLKVNPEIGEHKVFAFLTCEPNAIVAPIHPKAMPVLLDDPALWRAWLEAPVDAALALAAPLPPERMLQLS